MKKEPTVEDEDEDEDERSERLFMEPWSQQSPFQGIAHRCQ